jgi:hypothetical protein
MTEGRFFLGMAIVWLTLISGVIFIAASDMKRSDANLRECLAAGGSWVADNCIVPLKMSEIDAP